MRRIRAIAFAAVVLSATGTARPADVTVADVLQVLGSVTSAARPVGNALVIALNLGNLDAIQTFSTSDGNFALPPLRSGIYKIIAVKYGYAPAMAMVVPNKASQRLTLKLGNENSARGKDARTAIWEIRGSLPADILRELDAVMAPPQALEHIDTPRFKGEMASMTGMAEQSPAFAQTVLGVQSRIGENWQLGFTGNLHRIDDPTDDSRFGTPAAESSVMSMELRSSPTDAYRVASTKSWWRYRDSADVPDQTADVRSHNFEWQHGDARVQVRYLAQQNLFTASPAGSDLFEIGGNTMLVHTDRNDLGVALRVSQESSHTAGSVVFRTADVTANGAVAIVPSFSVQYGVSSRVGVDGTAWAPRTGIEWKLTEQTSFVATGMLKVYDAVRDGIYPSIVVFSDDSRVLPRYSYSFGFVNGGDAANNFSAIATVSAVDAPQRVIFSNGFEPFWDGLYLDAGDVRRDLRLGYHREVGTKFAFAMSGSAGVATPELPSSIRKVYVTGDLQSTFNPTGTTLAISFREIHQPQTATASTKPNYRSERVNVHMAQSLHLPLDLKVLFGLELAHAENSPFLLDTLEPQGATRKYIGGLALNF
ncbi:MAG: hypothetical protein JWO97_1020 [Acidobacteria bacterium]|nr:hypothetical protein [Acidobacteriota bacterium]